MGTLEGQYKRKTGNLIAFSEQNVLDCMENVGCNVDGYAGNVRKIIQYYEEKNVMFICDKMGGLLLNSNI